MADSNAEVTRRNDVVPGDLQDNPPDGQTSTITWADPDNVNWGDALQHFMLRVGDDLGRVGTLAQRPAAEPDNPVWWLVTDDGGPYLTFNDGSAWQTFSVLPDGSFRVRDDLEGYILGENTSVVFTEGGSPTGWTFFADGDVDLHSQTDLDISNNTGSQVTEDVTVELYEGSGTGGTLLLSETRSITVNASSTNEDEKFVDQTKSLNFNQHYINVTTSGSTLVIDTAYEKTEGVTQTLKQDGDGTFLLTSNVGVTNILTADPVTTDVDIPNGTLSEQGTPVLTGEPTTASDSVTLSGGSATVDTGVTVDDSTFWNVSLAPENGADVAASLEDDTGGTGNYLLHIEENTTTVGNPTVNWKLTEDVL